MQTSLSEAAPLPWEGRKGLLLFALVFVLVAACSLSFYYSHIAVLNASFASSGVRAFEAEDASDEVAMPPAAMKRLGGQGGKGIGVD